MMKNNCCYVLDSVLKLSKTWRKDKCFAWRDPVGVSTNKEKKKEEKHIQKIKINHNEQKGK
jgi:hypothetical protein